MTVNGAKVGSLLLRVEFTLQVGGDVDVTMAGQGVSRREAAQMLAKLAAELAQAAAREEPEP